VRTAAGSNLQVWHLGSEFRQGEIMSGYYVACKHQLMISTVNNNVPGPMFSDKTVFTFSETACSESPVAHTFVQITLHDNDVITKQINTHYFKYVIPNGISVCHPRDHSTHVQWMMMWRKFGDISSQDCF
jgi:hypothetical protein